jgi:hypothetical protein
MLLISLREIHVPKGSIIPRAPTVAAVFQLLTRNLISASRPTRKRKKTSPMLATRLRGGIDAVGKIVEVKPGIWPMTDG